MCSQRLIRTEEAQILLNSAAHVHICLTSVDHIHFPFRNDEDNFIANPLKNSPSPAVFTYAAAIPTISHQLPATRGRGTLNHFSVELHQLLS